MVCMCFVQTTSGSRWRGYAGRPEATCRSWASTSSGGASYASPAARSCDPRPRRDAKHLCGETGRTWKHSRTARRGRLFPVCPAGWKADSQWQRKDDLKTTKTKTVGWWFWATCNIVTHLYSPPPAGGLDWRIVGIKDRFLKHQQCLLTAI